MRSVSVPLLGCFCTPKADCRCAGESRTPRVAHMVGTPFGVSGVRLLLRAFTAAQTALGLQLRVGPREPWNVPVAPKAGQTTKLVAHAWPEGLRCCRSVPLVLAKAGSSGSNQLQRAYFWPHFHLLDFTILDSKESALLYSLCQSFGRSQPKSEFLAS